MLCRDVTLSSACVNTCDDSSIALTCRQLDSFSFVLHSTYNVVVSAMAPFPTSRRGQQNVKPDLMIDLSRRVAENAYNKNSNPTGIIDLGSAVNDLMIDDLGKWIKKHETSEDRKNCPLPVLLSIALTRRGISSASRD